MHGALFIGLNLAFDINRLQILFPEAKFVIQWHCNVFFVFLKKKKKKQRTSFHMNAQLLEAGRA